jgi:hypothetical protein
MNSREFYQRVNAVEDIIRENFKFIVVLLGGYIAAAEYGIISYPELPEGTWVIVTGGLAAVATGFIAAKKIDGLLPDPEGIFIVEFESSDDTGGSVWELSPDQFDAMEITNGSLFPWPGTSKQVYEVKEYRPEENVAVANWRESVAGSELAGDKRVPDVFASIEELRSEFEPEARKYRLLQRRIRKVTRKLDRRRLRDQEALLDEHTTPAFDDDGATVSGILREELPDELLPDSMKPDKWDRDGEIRETNGTDTAADSDEIEAVVEFDEIGEAIEPIDGNAGREN